ncbi:hypothetical protein GOV13_03195 [Candidatus Pacearchaeota archaeon]|nr:hypothetical protein [Candidatus Pacearchaeota archaeon]
MKKELLEYGLTDKEAEIYLAALKAGECTANRLSELTGMRRSTIYDIVESLKRKGLLISFKKNKKYYFNASPPESLLNRLKEKEDVVKRILPSLNKLTKALPEKPALQLFEGKIGIKNAVEDMLNSREILIYGAAKAGDEVFGVYTENFARKRVEKKIMLKAVIGSDVPEHMIDKDVKRFTKIRILESFKNHNSAYFIYDDKLIIITLGEELIAIRIKSPLLAESQRKVFNVLWKIGKVV